MPALLENPLEFFKTWDTLLPLLEKVVVVIGGLSFVAFITYTTLRKYISTVHRHTSRLNDTLKRTIQATRMWLLLFPTIFLAIQPLDLAGKTYTLLKIIATISFALQLGLWAKQFVRLGIRYVSAQAAPNDSVESLGVLNFIGQTTLWSIVILMALSNLGVNITALVAGMGIGGIAIALAIQNILGDLFASLSIVIDKPFITHDFIIVDDYMGTVEHIGVKTTRIRSLGGEQIIFSNNDLLKSRVRNYKRMYERRVVLHFGVLYQTPLIKLRHIPVIIQTLIKNIAHVRFDRAHFYQFGESSLEFEVVYWVLDPDYHLHMDIQQIINLQLIEELQKEDIKFAYPTRTVLVET